MNDLKKLGELTKSLALEAPLVCPGLHGEYRLSCLIDEASGCIADFKIGVVNGQLEYFDLTFNRQP